MKPKVIIKATDEDEVVIVSEKTRERFEFTLPAMLTGSDLRDVLTACGIRVRYSYHDQASRFRFDPLIPSAPPMQLNGEAQHRAFRVR